MRRRDTWREPAAIDHTRDHRGRNTFTIQRIGEHGSHQLVSLNDEHTHRRLTDNLREGCIKFFGF